MKKKLTLSDKYRILSRLIYYYQWNGESINTLIGKPFSYFDWDAVQEELEKQEKEYEKQN